MKFTIKHFFSKCDQIRSDLVAFTEKILNENPEKILNDNFIFCAFSLQLALDRQIHHINISFSLLSA